jgi:hypothetical protein
VTNLAQNLTDTSRRLRRSHGAQPRRDRDPYRRLDAAASSKTPAQLPPLPPGGRWWGEHLRETRWRLELAQLLADPVLHGSGVPAATAGVRLTSIYPKGDGVVRWQAAVVPYGDCVEVTGSHAGLIFNPKAYRAVATALAKPELP